MGTIAMGKYAFHTYGIMAAVTEIETIVMGKYAFHTYSMVSRQLGLK